MAVANHPVLTTADFSKRFILQTDASSVVVAAVLLQQYHDGRKPIAFAFSTLTDQYSTYDLEALAVLFAVEKFRIYIKHVEFDLEADILALRCCFARPQKTGKLATWTVRLSAFKFIPHHIKGSDNVVAEFYLAHVSTRRGVVRTGGCSCSKCSCGLFGQFCLRLLCRWFLILSSFSVKIRLIDILPAVYFSDLALYKMLIYVSVRPFLACVKQAVQEVWSVSKLHSFV